MMSTTTTDDLEGHMSFMNQYSSLLSPVSEFDNSIPYHHDQLLKAGRGIVQPPHSNDGPASTPNIMDLSEGGVNAALDQENGKSDHKISRRSYKGDRHSKIPTAQGLRDRRMRLSLDVARQFFKLQDMLSYDKPSNTVKWLLLQAKSAIKKLRETSESPSTNGTKSSASPASEGEVAESIIDGDIENRKLIRASTSKGKSKQLRKNTFNPAAKELRKKARERARERTQKKEKAKALDEVMNLDQGRVRRKGALELEQVLSGPESRNMTSSSHGYFEIERPIQDERNLLGTRDDLSGTPLAVSSDWSPQMSLSYHEEDKTCQLYPISEFDQYHGTSWEAYSAPDLCQYWNSL